MIIWWTVGKGGSIEAIVGLAFDLMPEVLAGLWRDDIALNRHCEERSDAAIQSFRRGTLDCFAYARKDGWINVMSSGSH